MPNDAKLGLVVGVALVIAVAVIFWRKDPTPAQPLPGAGTNSVSSANPLDFAAPPRASYHPARAKVPARTTGSETEEAVEPTRPNNNPGQANPSPGVE